MVTTVKNDSQLTEPCIRCGRPATREHHAVDHEDGTTGAIGMGGSSIDHEHERVAICRDDHRRTHEGDFYIVRAGDLIRCISPDGELLAERALEFRDAEIVPQVQDAPDFPSARNLLPFLSDEGLAELWEQGDELARSGLLYQCMIADALHDRYHSYGASWWKRVAEIIGTSPQTVYSRWRMWAYLSGVPEPEQEIARLGVATVEALGARARRGEDVTALADEADALLSNGSTRTAVALAVRDGETRVLPCADGAHRCRYCGMELSV